MELKHFLWWFIMLVLFSLCINGCFGCLEEERIALLQLKASINYPNGSSLSYWDDSTNKVSDCCQWKYLECNNTTRRVIRLHLDYVRDYRLGDWYLNASLFLPFRELNYLDLSNNGISGWVPNEGFNRFSRLNKLEVLVLDENRFNGSFLSSISAVASLKELHMRYNDQSEQQISIPAELGRLNNLKELYLYGSYIEKSFLQRAGNMTSLDVLTMVGCRLNGSLPTQELEAQQEVEFTTKRRSYSYKGHILDYMSGIDLSCNSFCGEIPAELGKLSNIHALNLSFNNLTGSIPMEFSRLEQIESLDLSYNNLNGIIPSQLIELHSLAVFSVAHNNLSGTTPERKDQFGTFDESSYEGNPLLCGPPLVKDCRKNGAPSAMPTDHEGEEGDSFNIDMVAFNISFVVSYAVVLMTIAGVLYINPYWRQAWFYFIEVCITNFYCFVVINFRRISNFI